MFGIGYQEMFVILVVAMIVFGPRRLPEIAGQVGRWVRDFRRMSSDLTGEFEKTFAEVEEVKKSFKRELDSIQDEVEGVGKSARGDLKKTTAKSTAGAKKPAALGSGTGKTSASGLKGKLLGANGKATAASNGSADALTAVASKADPLVDVSFFDADFVALKTAGASANGSSHGTEDDALSRVRRRRASAGYARRTSA